MSEADTNLEEGEDARAQDSKVRILIARAADFLHEDRVGEARLDLAHALRLQPNNEQAKNLLGLCLFRLGDLSGAKRIFTELIGKNENESSLYLNLAMVQLKAEDFAEARATLEVALELRPGHRRAAGFLGLTLERLGLFHDAGVWYDKAEQHERATEMRKKAQAKASAAATRRALGANPAFLESPLVTPAQFAEVTPPPPAAADAESDPEALLLSEPPGTAGNSFADGADSEPELNSDAAHPERTSRSDEEVPEPPPLMAGETAERTFADPPALRSPTPEMPEVFDFDLSAEMERFSDSLVDEVIEEDASQFAPPDADVSAHEFLPSPPPSIAEPTEPHASYAAEDEDPLPEPLPSARQDMTVQPQVSQEPQDDAQARPLSEETTKIVAAPAAKSDASLATELDPPEPLDGNDVLESASERQSNAEREAAATKKPTLAYEDNIPEPDITREVGQDLVATSPTEPHVVVGDAPPSETPSPDDDAKRAHHEIPPASQGDEQTAEFSPATQSPAGPQSVAAERAGTPPAPPRVFGSLQDLVTARLQSLLPEDDPRIEGDLFRFPVRGKAFVRSDLVVSLSGDLKSEVVYRRYQGESTDGYFGGETQGMWEIQGLGLAYLDVSQVELTQLYLTKENLYLLESALVAFGVGFRFENGRLPDEDGDDLDLVQIEGSGFVALGTSTPLFVLPVKDRQPVHVRADRLVGFTGELLPSRLSTSAPLQPVSHSSLQFEGNGFVLTR